MRTIIPLLCLLAPSLWAQDLTVDIFTDGHFNTPNPVQEVDVVFPDDGRLYARVDLVLTLEAPDGLDGDEWDRMGHIYMYDDEGNWVELARLITPFWNPPWTWTLDITEMQSLFQGQKRVGVWLQSWKDDGYQVSVSLDFYNGTPPLLPIRHSNTWNGAMWGYGNEGNTRMEQWLQIFTLDTNTNVDQFLSRVSVTGHRFVDNSLNAAEFLRASRELIVNGGGNWTNELWQLCGTWPVQPQSPGTWQFDRSGWCPGDLVDPWIVDITSQVTAGQDVTMEYLPDEYINVGTAQDAHEQFGSTMIEMRSTSNTMVATPGKPFMVDARTDDVLAGRSLDYRLYNFHGSTINITATASEPWLDVTEAATVNGGNNAVFSANLNANADTMEAGDYEATITFTDTTNNFSEVRKVQLKLAEPGLVAHWRFDESSGTTAADSSGNGYDGTLQGGLDFGTNSVPGQKGNALDFDGVDDMINAANVPIKAPFSLATYVKPHDITRTSGFAYKFDSRQNSFWFGQPSADGQVRLVVYPTFFGKGQSSSEVMTNDEWVHVTASYDGHTVKIYLDGVLHVTSTDFNGPLPDKLGNFIMGRFNNNWFDGVLDDFRVYNFALDEDDIEAIFCRADLNGDETVDGNDVALAYAAWGGDLPDLTGDGFANIIDLMHIEANQGNCP